MIKNMTTLFLGDLFHDIFEVEFGISEQEVIKTYSQPDFFQELAIGIKLFIKKLDVGENKIYLLLCAQAEEESDILAFTYWIPKNIVDANTEPLNILKEFILAFGLRIKIGYIEDIFIEKTTVAINSALKNLEQEIQIPNSEHIPYLYNLFDNNKFVVSETLVFYDIYYAFAVSKNKYIRWLHVLPEVKIEFPKNWTNNILELIERLELNGKTGLKVLKQRNRPVDEIQVTDELTEVSVPKDYAKPLSYISKTLASLKPNEKLVVIPRFSPPKCMFCGSMDTSSEHIFAEWLRPYFKVQEFKSTLCMTAANDGEGIDTFLQSRFENRKEYSNGYTTEEVCISCNNTWMSDLEKNAKSILVTNDEKVTDNLGDIDKYDASLLSRWLVKISLLLIYKTMYQSVFFPNQYRSLKEGYIPNGVIVEATEAQSYKLNFSCSYRASPLVLIKCNKIPSNEELTDNFFVVCIQIGKLLFRISFLPPDSPLRRQICLKRTDILFPWKSFLPFCNLDTDEETWSKVVAEDMEMQMFVSGMFLSE